MSIIKEDDWREPIKWFLKNQFEFENPLELRKVKTQVAHYCIIGDELYRREIENNDHPLRICLKEGRRKKEKTL